MNDRLRELWDETARHLAALPEEWGAPDTELTAEDLAEVLQAVEAGRLPTMPKGRAGMAEAWVEEPFLAAAPELGPVVMTVALAKAGVLLERAYGAVPDGPPYTGRLLTALAGEIYDRIHAVDGLTLLEISQLLDALGLDGPRLVVDRYRSSYRGLGATWPAQDVAPFVLETLPMWLELVRAGVDPQFDPEAPYRALATLPQLPESAVDALFEAAFGRRKSARRFAQDALGGGHEDRIIVALSNRSAEVRAEAERWLERLGRPVAEPPVDRVGPPETPTPKGLEWLRFEDLPPMHWADTGAVIPPSLLKWVVCQAVNNKSPEPNALVRSYGKLIAEREDFACFLLERWIARGAVINLKGLLAVVAACGGQRSVVLADQHLNEWYGVRVAQSKALIGMLAWIDHPAATQLVLSVGTRFRTKSLQEEAARQAKALAARKGWTTDELADRSVPTEPDKKTVKVQTARLYEAMCTGRTWRYQDWQEHLNQHPVMRKLVQRLVWTSDQVFRPLDDGRLVDVNDDVVELPADARIAIAHDAVVDDETRLRWQHYLADYEIATLFQQFGKELYRLPDKRADDHRLTDFEGRQLLAFTLRSTARKLGYLRGQTLDGPSFDEYEKPFPSIGLVAVVTFSGNSLPEENRTVGLGALCFWQVQPDGGRTAVRLGDVPPVLLSETYHDLRVIAGGI
ncbi:DUF4132 domain-containing protein [Kribbella sp. CA-253562]|uniref:DUF4132 domain-containing protein n=1 Tax=Kribbella sp. CA-253562 TaxID=3239942 RepID=UPI003D8FFB1E